MAVRADPPEKVEYAAARSAVELFCNDSFHLGTDTLVHLGMFKTIFNVYKIQDIDTQQRVRELALGCMAYIKGEKFQCELIDYCKRSPCSRSYFERQEFIEKVDRLIQRRIAASKPWYLIHYHLTEENLRSIEDKICKSLLVIFVIGCVVALLYMIITNR